MDETLQQLGRRMREVRTSLGLTLRQLAARTGLSASMLCHIEKGQANPTTQSLAAIADALHCLPGSLFTPAESQDGEPSTSPCWMVLPAAMRSWHDRLSTRPPLQQPRPRANASSVGELLHTAPGGGLNARAASPAAEGKQAFLLSGRATNRNLSMYTSFAVVVVISLPGERR